MKFVLTCDCGSTDFQYNEDGTFTCRECGETFTEDEAGSNLLGDTDF